MANEFQHKDPGSELTQAEYITTDGTGHIFDCQATGDIMYASSATVLKNLGKGAANTVLSMGGSCIPAWTASPSVTDLTIGGGCITLSAATDIDLLDNNASALSFDATGKTGIIDIVTTNGSEGVTMSGTLGITGILTANAGVVVDNFTLDGTELDLSTGDFALDVAGDIEVNADGGCINFKDASLALAAIVNTSCVGELRIHEAANYIGLKPPALSANQTWTWPATKGSADEVLTCDGCGVLSWEAAGGGATVREGGQTTEATTTSTSAADLISATSLTICGGDLATLIADARKTTGAAADAGMGLKENCTIVFEGVAGGQIMWRSESSNEAVSGMMWKTFGARVTNYIDGVLIGIHSAFSTADVVRAMQQGPNCNQTAAHITAQITSLVLRGIVGDSNVTLGADEMHVYSLAVS